MSESPSGQGTEPLTAHIEAMGADAWAQAYVRDVSEAVRRGVADYLRAAPWRSRARFHVLLDERPYAIYEPITERQDVFAIAVGHDVILRLASYGRVLTIDPAVWRNDDRGHLSAVPSAMIRAGIRTMEAAIAATDGGDTTARLHVGLRDSDTQMPVNVWRVADEARGDVPWTADMPLVLGWSFDFGVTAVRDERSAVPA